MATNPIIETRLDNGLTVLTREIHHSPVATFWVWYRVGSRNEGPGITGISHWVEHMLFKGTPKLGKGDIFRQISKNGGTLNGFTWLDFTAYFETLPSDRLDLAIGIESDRMVNSTFDPEEFESERTVIISEREGSENHPTFHLDEEVNAAAFKVHPYGNGVIGWKCDLQAMTRDELYNHYKTFYAPNNAIVVAAGDFDTERLLERIEESFGSIPAGPPIRPVRSVEPAPFGERRVEVRRPGANPYIEIAYHAPSASNPDLYPMIVLDAILSGAKPMGLFGGRGTAMGRSARLYRRLVDAELASGASSGFALTLDPYLFSISAVLRPGVDLQKVETAVDEEIDQLLQDGVAESEVAIAKKQVRAQLAYASEGVTNQGYWLGSLETVDSYKTFDSLLDRVEEVQAEDVHRVAQSFLTKDKRTVGWFIPTAEGSGGAAATPAAVRPSRFRPRFFSDGVKSQTAALPNVKRRVLDNGMTVLSSENRVNPVAILRISMPAGTIYEPADKMGLAYFHGRMLQRGTSQHSFQDLNKLTDSIGASLGASAGERSLAISIKCLREDLDLLGDLAADLIRRPTFPESEIEKVRGEVLTALRELQNNTRSVAGREFYRTIYGDEHPYSRWRMGTEQTVNSFTQSDLMEFHQSLVGPPGATVIATGDVGLDRLSSLLDSMFAGWESSRPAPDKWDVPQACRPAEPIRRHLTVEGKTQTDIIVGLPVISRRDPDFYALNMADLVLGGLGLMGRLGANVRDEQGLAYYVYSSLGVSHGPGAWTVRAGVNPANVDRAIDSIRHEIDVLTTEKVAPDELADGKSYLTGVLPLSTETNDGVAAILNRVESYDLGLDYLDRFPDIVNALTDDEVLEAAQRHLLPDNMIIVTAGPPEVSPEQ